MTPIFNRLRDALHVTICNSPRGSRPTALYLGTEEKESWGEYVNSMPHTVAVGNHGKRVLRDEFLGIPIYLVDAPNHLHFSYPK